MKALSFIILVFIARGDAPFGRHEGRASHAPKGDFSPHMSLKNRFGFNLPLRANSARLFLKTNLHRHMQVGKEERGRGYRAVAPQRGCGVEQARSDAVGVGVLDDPAERTEWIADPRRIRAALRVGGDDPGAPADLSSNVCQSPANSHLENLRRRGASRSARLLDFASGERRAQATRPTVLRRGASPL